MKTVDAYRCKCGGKVAKALVEDEPGEHTYVWKCRSCGAEFGDEWKIRHRGESELGPIIDLTAWIDLSVAA